MENSKTCSKCAASKPVSEFFFKDVAKTKYRSACRVCHAAAIQQRQMTPEVAQALKVKERARNKARSAYLQDYMQTYSALHKDHLNAMARAREATKPKQVPTSSDVFFVHCQQTGTLFTAKGHGAKYCPEGRRLASLDKSKQRHAQQHDQRGLTYTCKQCEHPFTPAYGTGAGKRLYCSPECTRASDKANGYRCNHRQRARAYGVPYEYINPLAVFERDGWCCRICRLPTPKDKRGTYEPDAPELDHIKPLSRGGGHLLRNVQCTCRSCNGAKGARLPD